MTGPDFTPLWYLARGGLPTRAEDWRSKQPPAYACREGDAAWAPLAPERWQELADRVGKRTRGGD